MFESLSTRLQDVFKTPSRRVAADAREHRSGAARDSARAARSRRQLQGRQGVHRSRPRPGDGRAAGQQRPARPVAVAAGRQDRPRRDGGALRRRRRRPPADEQAAAGHPAARPAGRRQDDDGREAGEVAGEAGTPSAAGVDRRQAAGGDSAAERRRRRRRRCACTIRRRRWIRWRARRARWPKPARSASTR